MRRPSGFRAALAVVALLVPLAGCMRAHRPAPEKVPAAIAPAPAFRATNYDGRTVDNASLRGHVYLVEFMFTTCAGPCPTMNSTMNVLQAEFSSYPDFRIVSFTVDPETDTPEQLAHYAERYGAKPDRWYFLRTDVAAVADLAANGFKMGDPDHPKMHSTHFALVDRRGMIRGYYDALDAAKVDELRGAVRALEAERS